MRLTMLRNDGMDEPHIGEGGDWPPPSYISSADEFNYEYGLEQSVR